MWDISVKIGTSSLPDVYPIFKGTHALEGKYGIVLDTMNNHNFGEIIDNIHQAYEWAVNSNIDIWILPELCFPNDIYLALIELLNTQSGSMKLVVAGSTNIQDGNVYRNRLNILEKNLHTNQWQRASVVYDKKEAFSCGLITTSNGTPTGENMVQLSQEAAAHHCTSLIEDIVSTTSNPIYTFIKENRIIKIGFGICLDVLNLLDNKNPLANYIADHNKADLMLVVSMNEGFTNLFTGGAECMARWYDCATVYVNSMTSVSDTITAQKSIEMSYAILPHPTKPGGVRGKVYYKEPPIFSGSPNVNQAELYKNVSLVFSNGVKAEKINADGNVLYNIVDGTLA